MKNNVLTVILAAALFCGSAIADDGNMGSGNYTGCDGTNPPPTCDCNLPDPPDSCQNQGGFANSQYSNGETSDVDYFLTGEIAGERIMSLF